MSGVGALVDGRIRIAAAAWLATMAAAASLLPLIDGSDWLVQAGLLLAAQTATGMVVRWRGVPAVLTVAAQVLVSLLLLTLVAVPEYATGGLLPGPAAFDRFGVLLSAGAEDIGHYVAPAPATDGIRLTVFLSVLLIGLTVDVLAVTLQGAAPAGLPLLALYSVAAGIGHSGPSWPYFLSAAAGYLLLLLAEGRDRVTKWGSFFSGPGTGRRMTTGDAAAGPRVRTGRRIGVLTLGVAVLAPLLLPSLGEGLLDPDGGGDGGSGGPGDVVSVNPVVALQDQLSQPQDRRVLSYRTDSEQPAEMYLRLVALDEFTGAEWRSSGWHDDAPPNPPWPVTGLAADVAADRVTTVVEATPGYAQTSLPVPYPALSIAFADAEAGADPVEGWSFDRGTQTLFRPDGEASTQGRTWRVEHLLVRPTAEQLAGAPAAPQEMSDYYTQLPSDLPAEVAATARDVTAGAANAYEQAVALQEWFTQRGGFRYDTSVASGSGSEAIVDFLRRKEGFCVHFAFTMAAMARTLDIPAQVAVGFTPGERRPDGSYDVGIHNAHAWPELYFEGVGWVRFEPTPGQGNAPSYTRPEESRPEQEEPEQTEPTPRPETEDPSPSPSPSPSQRCDEPGGCGEQPRTPDDDRDEAGLPLLGPALWIGGALLVLAVPAAPVLWRRRRRARRLAPAAGVLGAWRELLDTAWDFGITPVAAETPRQAAERVVRVTGLAGEPAGAVHRVAAAVEEELYAPPAAHGIRPGGRNPAADVRAACAGLRAGASRWERLRATFLPRSAVRVRDGVRERWAGLRLPRFAGRPRPARR